MSAGLTALAIAAITSLLLSSNGTTARPTAPCPVGEVRNLDPDIFLDEPPVTQPFVIGCAGLRHLGRRELIAYREGPSPAEGSICVLTLFRGSPSESCRDPGKRLHALDWNLTSAAHRGRPWLYFFGFASERVAGVRLRYRSGGRVRRPRGILTTLRDPALLARLGLDKPLTHFTAEASLRTDRVVVLARNQAGKLIFRESTGDLEGIEGVPPIGSLP